MIVMMMKMTIIMMKNDLEGNVGSWTTARSTKQRRRICLVQPLLVIVKALNHTNHESVNNIVSE